MNHTLPIFDTINGSPPITQSIVLALLKQYFNIAFLMGKPQDLPAGDTQLVTGVVLNFITYVLALVAIYGTGSAVLHASVDIGFTGLFLYLALMFTSKLPRFQQAFGAMCGAGAVLNLSAILMLFPMMASDGEGAGSALSAFAYYLLLVWSLSLAAHVIRHTFGIRMVTSIGVALLYYLFISSLLVSLFPAESTEIDGLSLFWSNGVRIATLLA